MGAANIKVEAMKVLYGATVAQIEKILTRADTVANTLGGKYIKLYTPSGAFHIFWFDRGADSAPVVAGAASTNEVAITALDSAATIAGLLQAVIAAHAAYLATASGNEVTVTHAATGYASSAEDGHSPLNTQFGLQILTQGDTQAELGCVEGDIEVNFSETFADVKCHDTGTTPIASLKTGVESVEVTLAALETVKSKIMPLFVKTNGSFTPDGGTEVFGMGTFKNFENMFKFASKLVLHPVRLLDDDHSEDWTFHKAIPKLDGITFSGENPLTLPLTFQVFPDETVNARVNYFSIGDGTQSLIP